jgi:hypothetical protein
LARRLDYREPATFDQLASSGIPAVLALEIAAIRKSKLPADIRIVIHRMAAENPTWGEERIADE